MSEMVTQEECFVPTHENTNTYEATVRVEKPNILKTAKQKVALLYRKRAEIEAEKIPFQGAMLSFLAEEKEDISWQALIHKVPRGVLGWAVRAGTNSLATPDNLARWGVKVDQKCRVADCTAVCTLGHLLNHCSKSLDRFKFRHDSCLSYLIKRIMACKADKLKVYADLEGWKINGGTVPPDLVTTGQVPDIVLLDRTEKKIMLLELTCPFDSSARSFKSAEDRKTDRYERLTLDLQGLGYTALNTPLEIGSRGVITARNHMVLASVASMCGIRDLKNFRKTLGKISLLASHRIYMARASSEWTSGEFIKP